MRDTEAQARRAKGQLALSMFLFGTIGVFRRGIGLPSGVIALARAAVGTVFLLLLMAARGARLSSRAVRRNLGPLCLSGALLGFNWILLFEAYRYTSVATATLCYYMAPTFVVLASPLLLREKLTRRRALCAAAAFGGMVLVSGVPETGLSGAGELKGVLLGLAAAVFYAAVVLLNRHLRDVPAYDRTVVQLGAAAAVLLPYTLLAEGWGALRLTPFSVAMLLVMGVVHTGLAYALYFGATRTLQAQTLALYSYIDPVVAVLLSALLLHERMSPLSALGAAAVLLAAAVGELPEKPAEKTA
ncbi:MAG: DMT family transporter [Oscillospiraceae bacterium]